MRDFYDITLPDFLHSYIIGGPTFDTQIVQSIAGLESRYANFTSALHKYHIKNCKLSPDELSELYSFFLNCKGAAYGFRMKDYADYQGVNQLIEQDQDDKSLYYLYKIYSYQERLYRRRIVKPIKGSVAIFLNNNKIPASIDYSIGTVKMPFELAPQQTVTANFEFDLPVRFCADSLLYTYDKDGSILLEDLEIKEIII